jgi:hypothetical protein
MLSQHEYIPLVILMEDPIIHTNDHPFCGSDPSCPCHRDSTLLAEVTVLVAQGQLTQEEATQVITGTCGLSA